MKKLKYADCKTITVSFIKNASDKMLLIQDDGKALMKRILLSVMG
jgi:hypothetical protein